MARRFAIWACATALCSVTVAVEAQAPTARATGDATRGKQLFEKTYRCYACHGYDGQTGSPRLVPMQMAEPAFVAFLRKPPREAMPRFVDVAEQDLTDVYAYIKSIPVAAPPADTIPILKDVLQRRSQSTQTQKAR
jgi:mono/diheme cytochrome c family protein